MSFRWKRPSRASIPLILRWRSGGRRQAAGVGQRRGAPAGGRPARGPAAGAAAGGPGAARRGHRRAPPLARGGRVVHRHHHRPPPRHRCPPRTPPSLHPRCLPSFAAARLGLSMQPASPRPFSRLPEPLPARLLAAQQQAWCSGSELPAEVPAVVSCRAAQGHVRRIQGRGGYL